MNVRSFTILSVLALCATVRAGTANFDSFAEGYAAPTLTDGGITFDNLDLRLSGSTYNFIVEDASNTFAGLPGFSPANILGFAGYSPGPDAGFGRFYSMDFSTGASASSASLSVFSFASEAGSSLVLQGILGGSVVASNSIVLPTTFVLSSQTLSLGPGVYDSFRLVADSSTNEGTVFVSLDNVTVNPVPEPMSLSALGLGLAAVVRRRKRG